MAVERNVGTFMQRFSRANREREIADERERMMMLREEQAAAAQKSAEKQQSSSERSEPERLASQRGMNAPTPALITPGSPAPVPRENVGVGGSTGRVTSFDPSKAPAYLDDIARRNGINPLDFKRMAWIESRFDPNARARSSSAGGLFQFTDGTARSYGLGNKFDGVANAEAAARLWNDNKAYLSKALGREPSAGELYLAHQQGAGGAVKLLRNPNASAEAVLGSKAFRNNGGRPGMTAADFSRQWTGKFDGLREQATTPKSIMDTTNRTGPQRVAANATTMNDASPSRAQEMGGATVAQASPAAAVTPRSSTPAVAPAQTLPTDPSVPAPPGYYWNIGGPGEKPQLVSRETGKDMAGQPVPGSQTGVTPAATTPSGPSEFPNTAGQPAPPPPSRANEMVGPPMPTAEEELRSRQMGAAREYAQANPGQPTQTQPAAQEASDPIGGFIKGIGSIFDGPPIRDQYGREWDALQGWVDPKTQQPSQSSMLQQSSAQTADAPIRDQYGREWDMMQGWVDPKASAAEPTKSAAADSKSIIIDKDEDSKSPFSEAFNFFSTLFQ